MNTELNQERIKIFDAIKGIGIILVIIGHMAFDKSTAHFVYSFHMPLFFIVSGCLYATKEIIHPIHIIKKSVKRILIPYIFLVILSCIIAKTSLWWGGGIFIKRLLYIREMGPNGTLWFLPLYLIAVTIFVNIIAINKKISPNNFLLFLSTIISILVTIKFQQIFPDKSILMIGVLAPALGFMGLGYIFYKNKNVLYKDYTILAFLVFCVGILVLSHEGIEHIAKITTYLYFVCACCFSYVTFHIANHINSAFLNFIGKNSLLYMGIHSLVIHVYFRQHIKYWFSNHFDGLMLNIINILIILAITTGIIWSWNFITKKICEIYCKKIHQNENIIA